MVYYAFTTWLLLVPSTLPRIWACAVEFRIWYFNGCRNQFAISAIFNENKTKRSVKYSCIFTDSFHSHIILTGLLHEPQVRQYRSEYKLKGLCTFTIIYRIKTFTKNCNNAFFTASAIFLGLQIYTNYILIYTEDGFNFSVSVRFGTCLGKSVNYRNSFNLFGKDFVIFCTSFIKLNLHRCHLQLLLQLISIKSFVRRVECVLSTETLVSNWLGNNNVQEASIQ